MALYYHNTREDIPYFSSIKMFQDLKENDTIYLVDLETLKISTNIIENLKIDEKSETVSDFQYSMQIDNQQTLENKYTEYKYKSVSFAYNIGINFVDINIHFGTETNYLDYNINTLICTTEREAKQIIHIIGKKCSIQMDQFKQIFNGAGWDYAKPDVILG